MTYNREVDGFESLRVYQTTEKKMKQDINIFRYLIRVELADIQDPLWWHIIHSERSSAGNKVIHFFSFTKTISEDNLSFYSLIIGPFNISIGKRRKQC